MYIIIIILYMGTSQPSTVHSFITPTWMYRYSPYGTTQEDPYSQASILRGSPRQTNRSLSHVDPSQLTNHKFPQCAIPQVPLPRSSRSLCSGRHNTVGCLHHSRSTPSGGKVRQYTAYVILVHRRLMYRQPKCPHNCQSSWLGSSNSHS